MKVKDLFVFAGLMLLLSGCKESGEVEQGSASNAGSASISLKRIADSLERLEKK